MALEGGTMVLGKGIIKVRGKVTIKALEKAIITDHMMIMIRMKTSNNSESRWLLV